MKLSIIIPAYNAEPYIHELLDCLQPQLNDDVEVIVIDDGSKEPLKINRDHVRLIRKENGGVSSARNRGIDESKGDYISFIDADDMVAGNYVSSICARMPFDYLEMSWRSMPGGPQYIAKLSSLNDRLTNPSACTRAFNKLFIGNVRFNENKDSAEDEDFTRKLDLKHGNRQVVCDFLYFYRTYVENSGSKRFMRGECKTRRIVYYYDHINTSMKWLIDEVREEDKKNEVIVMTNRNDLPELEKYAQVRKPFNICGMELRGQYTSLFRKIYLAINTQIVIWLKHGGKIGGIETFVYNFCVNMHKYYDIIFLYEEADAAQLARLSKIVECIKYEKGMIINCDNLIVNRIMDKAPEGVNFKKKIQMCHTCKIVPSWKVPSDNDVTVFVSDVARKSFNMPGKVINNLMAEIPPKPLILISATRLMTFEKGEKRMRDFALLLKRHNINFMWLIFADKEIKNPVEGMVMMPPRLDVQAFYSMADYIVALSDAEAFGFTLVEALLSGTPLITTNLDVLKEIGFEDGIHGYTVPFNIDDSIDVGEIAKCNLKGFKYRYNNKKRIDQWHDILVESEK